MLEEERAQLGIFYRMPGNWDKHGANTVGFDAILKAMEVMTMVYCEFGRRPYFLCPTRVGGISLEYRHTHSIIEIEINDREENFAYLIDLGPDSADDERYFVEDNVPLEKLLYRLGQIIGPLEDVDRPWENLEWWQTQNVEIILNEEESRKFIEIMENPPEANPRLAKAFRDYYEAIASGKLVTDVVSMEEAREFLKGNV